MFSSPSSADWSGTDPVSTVSLGAASLALPVPPASDSVQVNPSNQSVQFLGRRPSQFRTSEYKSVAPLRPFGRTGVSWHLIAFQGYRCTASAAITEKGYGYCSPKSTVVTGCAKRRDAHPPLLVLPS